MRCCLIFLLALHAAQAGVGPPGASDVVMTSRSPHLTPDHGYTTWTAAKAFYANRVDWVYTTNA